MKKNSTRTTIVSSIVILLSLFLPGLLLAQCSDFTAATLYNSNNAQKGFMFNVVAGASPVIVTSFDINLSAGTSPVAIYYKSGTYVGSETTAGAWTLAGTVASLTSLGNNAATPVPITLNITIAASTTYGFYITVASAVSGTTVRYTNSVGYTTLASDANITVAGGVGKLYPFGSTIANRSANCTVHYSTGDLNLANVLTTTNSSAVVNAQNSAGTNTYAENCSKLICKVTGAGVSPITGSVTSKVWFESSQPATYSKRHYEITPATNAGTSTGRVTLYFTQSNFDDFNAVSGIDLPTGPADAAGIANLKIEKRPGSSSDGTGLPGTYSGTAITIDPVDADIVWNATDARWEVSFDVTGFSGFFVKSTNIILPLHLVSFSGRTFPNYNQLAWETADEISTSHFELESSVDGRTYTRIAQINAKGSGNNTYSYKDATLYNGDAYYRLKMVDIDGQFTYSQVIRIKNDAAPNERIVYPNPATSSVTISVGKALLNTKARLFDINGRFIQFIRIANNPQQVPLRSLTPGLYLVRFEDGSVIRFAKQ